MNTKGLILAGGYGSRLHPLTLGPSKQLLPVYDKPMVYYPLSVLMLADIRDVEIISTPKDISFFERLFGDGSKLGMNISYATQENPKGGIGEAFIISQSFIKDDNVALILGDNIFFGDQFSEKLNRARAYSDGGVIFGLPVSNPSRFGVVEFNDNDEIVSIEEKPPIPKSDYAVTGLYFYDNNVVDIAKSIKPSWRNELEITEINNVYLNKSRLNLIKLGRGFHWFDSGTTESLFDSSMFVKSIQESKSFYIACLEEIALNKKWISKNDLQSLIDKYPDNQYKEYLKKIINR
jgi:glucose-1-phosphate thymidylyltransferase